MLDFQAQQDKAKGRTTLLVVLYAIGLCVVAALTAPVLILLVVAVTSDRSRSVDTVLGVVNHPVRFAESGTGQLILGGAMVLTLAVMLIASLHRLAVLRGGGAVVARDLGAELVTPGSADPDERRLLNVVEEIAVAACVPVPPVYLLAGEPGVNALAAGYAPSDAVIVVTRGALRQLNREQLQAMIAHEFSHILNGDMRLNIRLMALLHGIVALSLLGRILMEAVRGSRRGGGVFFLAGLVIFAIGGIGAAVAGLIRAAVSRQREFLADASAVEFTRNPAGLVGALKTIGGLRVRGTISSPRASECSHMFFAEGNRFALTSVLSSHPSLESRIRRLDPAWDGRFPAVAPAPLSAGTPRAAAFADTSPIPLAAPAGSPAALRLSGLVAAASAAAAPTAWSAREVLERIRDARTTLDAIHPDLLRAARDSFDAQALVLAMLLSRRPDVAHVQLTAVTAALGEPAALRATALQRLQLIAGKDARLPLAMLALGTLASLSADQYAALRRALDQVLAANTRMDLFKLCLQRMLEAHLDRRHGGDARPVVQYYSLARLGPECSVLLSAVALAGRTADDSDALVRRAGEPLRIPGLEALKPEALTARSIHDALARLGEAAAPLRRRIVESCATMAGADGVLQPEERELVSAIADALQVPIL